jgi:hypothetical protein
MNNPDVIGYKAVLGLIEQSGHSKFIIRRFGEARQLPVVYEASHCKKNVEATKDFNQWATNMLYGNPNNSQLYEIYLFSSEEEANEENEANNRNDFKPGMRRKMKFTFCLNSEASPYQPQERQQQQPANFGSPVDLAAEIAKAVDLALTKREIDELRAENAELLEEIEELSGGGSNPMLDQVEDVFDRIEYMSEKGKKKKVVETEVKKEIQMSTQQPANVAGKEEVSENLKRIRAALQTLAKHDNDLAGDLERLAVLAETNKGQFEFVIKALRNMDNKK